MTEYVNLNFALEDVRNQSASSGRVGPRLLVLGPPNAGKTSLVKILTAYAIRLGEQPVLANLDPEEGLLSVPGTLTAAAFKTLLDVEEGWGSSPMSGPSPTPVKLPLVYGYGVRDPTMDEASSNYYKSVISRLALAVTGRQNEDALARKSGLLVDTSGSLANTTKSTATDIIQHIVSEFAVSHVLTLGSERLYSDVQRRFDGKPVASISSFTAGDGGSAPNNQEKITVFKASKSGGCVDRDEAFMRGYRAAQIRAYFLGNPHLSNGTALSPRQQSVDFSQLAIYRLLVGSEVSINGGAGGPSAGSAFNAPIDLFRPGGQEDEGDDEGSGVAAAAAGPNRSYGPSLTNDPLNNLAHILASTSNANAGNARSGNSKATASTAKPSDAAHLLSRLPPTSPPPPSLNSHILYVMNADAEPPRDTAAIAAQQQTAKHHHDILTSPVLGFLYVTEVDEARRSISLLSPVSGRLPVSRALVWSRGWPEEVVGIV